MVLAILAAQCFYFAFSNGQTVDETFYNGSGYPMVRYNDFRILGEHPPLIMQLGSLPLLFIQPKYPINDPTYIGNAAPTLDGFDVSVMGSRFLYESGNNASWILFLERSVVIAITLLLGIFVYLWAKDLYGPTGALLSLALYSFCPNIIAHGSIFTTDMGVSAFFFICLYFLKKFFEHSTLKYAIWTGIFAGLALLSKMSALTLVPIFSLLFVFFYFFQKRDPQPSSSWRFNVVVFSLAMFLFFLSIGQKIYTVGLGPICLIAASICLQEEKRKLSPKIFKLLQIAIWVCWIVFPIFLPQIAQKRNFFVWAAGSVWVLSAFLAYLFLNVTKKKLNVMFLIKIFAIIWFTASFVIILSYTDFPVTLLKGKPFYHYIRAFNIASSHSLGQHKVCVDGSFVTCDWKYFFALMSIKTPIYTLILFLFGLFTLWKSKMSRMNKAMLILPSAVFMFIASFVNQINIGLRHVLPVYPFIFLIAGSSWAVIEKFKNKLLKKGIVLLFWAGIFYFVICQIQASPHNLSYFNELIGSSEKAALYVADSNLIWGQDNKRLVQLMKRLGNPEIKLGLSFNNVPEFKYYGLNWKPMAETDFATPAPGFYALDLIVYTTEQKKTASWFKNRKPNFTAGRTIYIFKVNS